MADRVPDTKLAEAIRSLQNEIEEKYTILKALRAEFKPEEIDYYEYLKTAAWQEQRQRIFRRDGFRCVCCGETKNLNVHHITYENLGTEQECDLVTLCQPCHEKIHSKFVPTRREERYFTHDDIHLLSLAQLLGDYYLNLADELKLCPCHFEGRYMQENVALFNQGCFMDEDLEQIVPLYDEGYDSYSSEEIEEIAKQYFCVLSTQNWRFFLTRKKEIENTYNEIRSTPMIYELTRHEEKIDMKIRTALANIKTEIGC